MTIAAASAGMNERIRGGVKPRRTISSNLHPSIEVGASTQDLRGELDKAQAALHQAQAGGDERNAVYYEGVIGRLFDEARARAQRDGDANGAGRHPLTGQFVPATNFDGGTRAPLPTAAPTMTDLMRAATGRR